MGLSKETQKERRGAGKQKPQKEPTLKEQRDADKLEQLRQEFRR